MTFLIGQRVIYSDSEIVTTVQPPMGQRSTDTVQWVQRANGTKQWVSLTNLKPLPNGQL